MVTTSFRGFRARTDRIAASIDDPVGDMEVPVHALWSRNGRELFYRESSGAVMSVAGDPVPESPASTQQSAAAHRRVARTEARDQVWAPLPMTHTMSRVGAGYFVNHSGATIPTLAGRITDRMRAGSAARVPKGPMFERQKLYYEVAHATYPYPMAALRSFAPSSQILFGTDYPLEPIETTHVELEKLRLPADLQRAIDRTNAERLIPRLARPS